MLVLGTSGTIASGTDSHTHADFDSHSQSYTRGGWEVVYDAAGGPPYGVSASQISLTTTSLFGHDSGAIILAAQRSIASGNDSFTLIQADSNSHSMADRGPPGSFQKRKHARSRGLSESCAR